MPDLLTMEAFFQTLFGNSPPYIEFRTVMGEKFWREWTDVASASAKAESLLNRGYDIRFGVLPRKRGGGKEQDIAAYQLLYADLDVAPATAFARMSVLPDASVVVASGRGVHAYWVLDEAYTVAVHKTLWNRTQYALVHKLQADTQGIDPTRMLRIPTSYNAKREKPVELLDCTTKRFNLFAFAERLGITARVLQAEPTATPKKRSPVHMPANYEIEIAGEDAATEQVAGVPTTLTALLGAAGLKYTWNAKERIARLAQCPACLLGPKRQSEKNCAWVDVFGNLRCWRDGCLAGREQTPGGLYPAEWARPWLTATGRPALSDAAYLALETNR